MVALREQVLAALKARLETLIPGMPGLVVYRNRRASVPAARALIVKDGPHQTSNDVTGMKRHTMTALIEGRVQAASDDDVGAAANELYRLVIDAIDADVTLGVVPILGPATDCREVGLDFDIEDEAGTLQANAWFYLSVEIDFSARPGDSGTLAP